MKQCYDGENLERHILLSFLNLTEKKIRESHLLNTVYSTPQYHFKIEYKKKMVRIAVAVYYKVDRRGKILWESFAYVTATVMLKFKLIPRSSPWPSNSIYKLKYLNSTIYIRYIRYGSRDQ